MINPILLFLLISVLATPVFLLSLWRGSLLFTWTWVAFELAAEILAAVYSLRTFSGAFGPGVILFCLSPLLAGSSLALLASLRRRFRMEGPREFRRQRFYWFGGALIVLSQLAPFIGNESITLLCYSKNRRLAAPLIDALQMYQTDHERYPDTLQVLVPEYLPSLPQAACQQFAGDRAAAPIFDLKHCPRGDLLVIESINGVSIHRYHLATGRWSQVTFLDGSCALLY